jgi:hypothetical protein
MTAHYVGELVVVYVDGEIWKLDEDFGFVRPSGETITALKGYKTDFASIPWGCRWILPQAGAGGHTEYGKAAVIHDWMCDHSSTYPRHQADLTFLEAMEAGGVYRVVRYTLFYAVAFYTWLRKDSARSWHPTIKIS